MIRIRLSRILGDRRMSRAHLARITKIRENTIGMMYNEWTSRIDLKHLDRICSVLGCDIHDLLEFVPSEKWKDEDEPPETEEQGN